MQKPCSKIKRRKLKHLADRDRAALAAQESDSFKLNMDDPRFKEIYQRPEFAIDPNHPRFIGTEKMGKLSEKLSQGRKRGGVDKNELLVDS